LSAAARRVEPEWLDELPPQDARAMRSRRDLARVNALMSNASVVAGLLRAMLPAGKLRIAELGAGDGRFAARVVRRLAGREGHIVLVDRAPCVDDALSHELAARGWTVDVASADVFDWLVSAPPCDALVANLFLHHFDDAPLARLLALIAQRTRRFVACEPRRSALAATGARLLGAIGCGEVTRHDAVLSVRAGFAGAELRDLWTPEAGWIVQEGPRGLFSHVLRAHRP
jgi:hypothetical protein